MRGSGFRWRRIRRCQRTKRVLGWNRFTFRCHDATNVKERERKKERETIRRVPSSFNIK